MRLTIKTSLWMNVVLILIAVAAVAGAGRMVRDTLALRAELRDTRERLAAVSARHERLTQTLRERDEPEVVEYEAKNTLNLKRPGEEVVVVVPDERPVPGVESRGFWEWVKDFFSKIF